MHKNTLAFVVAAAIGGFIAGFWLANSINRSAAPVVPLQTSAANTSTSSSTSATAQDSDLSEAEIRDKIAEADRNPGNLAFQRDLGVSLYRYAAMKQDTQLLADAVRVLERASSLDPKDADVIVALGNAHFDIGFFKKDASSFQKARDEYTRSLTLKPDDADVMTDLGLTYFLQEPPDLDKAASQLEKVSAANPKHDRCLQFLVRVYAKQNRTADAEKTFAKLQTLNPKNSAIPELRTLLDEQKGGSK